MAAEVDASLPFGAYEACPLFHGINLAYPGLRLVRERPYIFLVDDFLSPAECAALVAKHAAAAARARGDGASRAPGTLQRTSACVCCEDDEVPAIRARLGVLTNASPAMLQPTKVSRYGAGDRFDLHTDAWSGDDPSDGDWFDDAGVAEDGSWPTNYAPGHNVACTVFVYLNDVAAGGRTVFPCAGLHRGFYDAPGPFRVDAYPDGAPVSAGAPPFYEDPRFLAFGEALAVAPVMGRAVLHFPSIVPGFGGRTDGNALHRAEAAVDEKFVLQQFVSSSGVWRVDGSSQSHGRLDGVTL